MKRTVFFAIFILSLSVSFSFAADLLVPSQYPTIQEAVDAAGRGDTVIVADGVYTGEGNTNIHIENKTITVCSENGPENCIIDCNNVGRGFEVYSYDCDFEYPGPNIEGFTITDGNSSRGGGILVDCSEQDYTCPTITNCIVTNNSVKKPYGYGGGICCIYGSPVISDCLITNNFSINWGGGGIFCGGSNARIKNCIIRENESLFIGPGGGFGGGIYSDHSEMLLENCVIEKNTAALDGGGIYTTNCELLSMKNCVIKENTAVYEGGGIYISANKSEISNCTINCNTAGEEGGGIYCEYSDTLIITDSILWNNEDISGSNEDAQITWDYDPDISYSCVQGWTGSWGGIGNFGDDPLLEDMNGCGDYHLQEASPCINAGDPNLLDIFHLKVDIDGQWRIMDSRVDIGVDEFAFPELIVTKPEGGEVWTAGSVHEIEWSSYLIEGTVDIYLSTDGGSGWFPAAMMVVDDGDYVWQLPDLMGSSECLLLAIPSEPEPEVICIESGPFIIRSDSPGSVVESRWKTLGGDFDRAGSSDVNGPELGCVKWQFETDGPVSAGVTIGFDGRMHIPCEDGKVYTVDANGLLLWSYDTNSPVLSSPTIGPDGTIYAGCENGKLYAIDIDGNLRWTHSTDGFIFSSPAVSEEGEVYVGSEDGVLYALGEDGSELWSFQTDGPGEIDTGSIYACPAVDSNGTIYIGGLYDPNVYALDGNDGTVKWTCNFESGGWPFASPVLSEEDGLIYQALIYGMKRIYEEEVPTITIYDANLYAIDANNGDIIWETEMSDIDSNWFEPYFTYEHHGLKELYNVSEWSWSEPALGPEGTIYVSFDDPYLRAVEPNGTIKWIKRFGMMGGFTLTVGSDGLVYAASDDGYLCVIDPNGRELARFESYGQLSYPVITKDNMLIVSDANNTVWAIGGEDCEGHQLDLHRPEDLSGDLIVNLIDFALLAERWLECTDKEEYSNYDIPTEELPCPNPGEQIYYISDIDRNLYVDLDDLAMLVEMWLSSD